jgi:hypothetical protein
MGNRRGTIATLLAIALVFAAAAVWLTDLATLPIAVALHFLEIFLHWVGVVWRL